MLGFGPGLPIGGTRYIYGLAASDLVGASASFDAPALAQGHVLGANEVTGASATFGTPNALETTSISPDTLVVAAPILDAPALSQVHGLATADMVSEPHVLDSLSVLQAHDLSIVEVVGATPLVGEPNLTEVVTLFAPDLYLAPHAELSFDFVNDTYLATKGVYEENSRLFENEGTVTRASTKWAEDSSGVLHEFAANIPAITDKGLLVEPSATNLAQHSNNPDSWATISATKSAYSGDFLGVFNAAQRVASTGSDWHRLKPETNTYAELAGAQFSIKLWYAAGTSNRARIVCRNDTTTSETRIVGTAGNLSVSQDVAGAISNLSQSTIDAAGLTVHVVSMAFTLSANGSLSFGIGPDTAVSGDDVIVLGSQIERGTTITSFIETAGASATRSHDRVTMDISDLDLSQGVYGRWKGEFLDGGENWRRVLNIGTSANPRNDISINYSGGNIEISNYLNGTPTNQSIGAWTLGSHEIVFGFGPNFLQAILDGTASAVNSGGNFPTTGLTQLNIGTGRSGTNGDTSNILHQELTLFAGTPTTEKLQALVGGHVPPLAPKFVFGEPTLAETDNLPAPVALATTPPSLGSPSIIQAHSLTINDLENEGPVVGTPGIDQVHVLLGNDLMNVAPEIDSPVIRQIHALDASDLVSETPEVYTPLLTQGQVLTAKSITANAHVLDSPALMQVHVLTPGDLLSSAPIVGFPILISDGGLFVRNNDTWSKPKVHVKYSGAWVEPIGGWIKNDGIWVPIYTPSSHDLS